MSSAKNGEQICLERRTSLYWRVTFDHPPLNIFGPETIPQLNEIVTALETETAVKVVVFDSAVDGFFLTHYNFLSKLEDTTRLLPGATGLSPVPDMLVRLSRAPVVSIASIRGRATGVGASLRSHAICVLPVSKGPSCRNLKLVLASCPVAGRWPDYLASSAEDGPWKCCSAPTTFLAILLSVMATSIVLYRTRNLMLLSRCWPCALLRSTNRPSWRRRISSILQACPPTQKLRPSGTHVLPLFSVLPPREESTHCWSAACISRAMLKIDWGTTWAS